jgi:sporulation protein YlmC with PRC-barrel domain
MLRRFTRLLGSRIIALDGEIGKVCDLYFDDVEWVVRYLVVDTGLWLPGRKVLISSHAVDSIDHVLHAALVSLTRERIHGSPNVDTDMLELQERRVADIRLSESHLRSVQEVAGYSIRAIDDSVGRLRDLLFDDETWAVRYLVVGTKRWFFGRRVLVRQGSVERVDWAAKCVDVSQMREQVEHGCEFDPDNPPLGDLEAALKRAATRQQTEH